MGDPAPEQHLWEEIRAFLADYDRRWQALDFAGVAALWDLDGGVPIYIGDEYATPVVGRHEFGRHIGRLGGRLRESTMRSTLFAAHGVGGDLAIAVYLLEWGFMTVESCTRHTGQRWVTAVLRRVGGEWRLIHHAESPARAIDPADWGRGDTEK